MKYKTARAKQRIEQVLLSPFVILGRGIGQFYTVENPGGVYMILPRYDAGGSFKVNADITRVIKDKKPLIIFTKRPSDAKYRNLYDMEGVRVLEIHKWIDNKYFHFMNAIWRGVLATWINRHEKPIVFGGEAIYFYKLLPYIKPTARKFEIVHVNKWMNYNQAFIPFMHERVFTAKKVMQDYIQHYKQSGVPKAYYKHLRFVENYVDMPTLNPTPDNGLKVLFIGRNSPQKRPELVVQIAEKITKQHSHFSFTLVGDLHEFESRSTSTIQIRTDISTQQQLNELYASHNVLILTSLFEGLPLVVMDMMAHGRVVLSTAVDGLKDNIEHGVNGLLINEIEDEEVIVQLACVQLLELAADVELQKSLGASARAHAEKNFSYENFENNWSSLFNA